MNNLTAEQQALLLLVRSSLWGEKLILESDIDWEKLDAIANEQAVVAFAYDGARYADVVVPNNIMQKWRGKLLAGVARNEKLLKAQDEVLGWFAEAEIPAVILKGSSVARYYPQPDLRVLGDIDVLVDKSHVNKAKELLEQHGYALHESDHEFHMGFGRPGAYVELHYHVTKLPNNSAGDVVRAVTARFLDALGQGQVAQHEFPVLSESDQAFSLLLHMIRHMFESGIGLRQVCDWMMYVSDADAQAFAEHTVPMLEKCGLLQYAKIATSACVRYLGLPAEKAQWCAVVSKEECQAFLESVFSNGNMGQANKHSLGSLFVDVGSMKTEDTTAAAIISNLNKLAYKQLPISKKCKALLPVYWVYLPARYFVRSMVGLRPKKSVRKATKSAKQQRKLFEMVRPFTTTDE